MNKIFPVQVASAALALVLLLLAASVALGIGGYDLSWFTIDGGGGTSSGGTFALRSTTGQFDAGQMSGGPYTLSGGYLAGEIKVNYTVLLPLVSRSP